MRSRLSRKTYFKRNIYRFKTKVTLYLFGQWKPKVCCLETVNPIITIFIVDENAFQHFYLVQPLELKTVPCLYSEKKKKHLFFYLYISNINLVSNSRFYNRLKYLRSAMQQNITDRYWTPLDIDSPLSKVVTQGRLVLIWGPECVSSS